MIGVQVELAFGLAERTLKLTTNLRQRPVIGGLDIVPGPVLEESPEGPQEPFFSSSPRGLLESMIVRFAQIIVGSSSSLIDWELTLVS